MLATLEQRLKQLSIPLLLIISVVGSAMLLAHQVFMYRQDFRALQQVQQARKQLDMEWGQLLIEQQTFGATPQIGSRAVMTLRMYSPPPAQTVILTSQD